MTNKFRRPDGITFAVPASDIHTPVPPESGDIVSFSCENHARSEVPVNPKIYRIRQDLTWPEVVRNEAEESKYLNGTWQSTFSSNMKLLFPLFLIFFFCFLVFFFFSLVCYYSMAPGYPKSTSKRMKFFWRNLQLCPLFALFSLLF